jgi:hypothetical protein
MNIIEKSSFGTALKGSGYHVLTFAETGFAMLNIYGEEFGLERNTIERFSQEVNRRDESGSLHPKAPISAVPRHLIRDDNDAETLADQIKEFLKANKNQIKANKLLIDFRAGVAPFVLEACRIALESPYANCIDEVFLINEN